MFRSITKSRPQPPVIDVSELPRDLEISFGDADKISGRNRHRRGEGVLLPNHFACVFDQHRSLAGAIGKSARQGYRGEHVEITGVGIGSRSQNFAENIDWLVGDDVDADFGILQKFAAVISARDLAAAVPIS